MPPALDRPCVGLFATCLVDVMRPTVGIAAATLLENAGCEVLVPSGQTCCGQPAYNGGHTSSAKALARHTMSLFAGCEYVVVPSGSCAGILKIHYPRLFDQGTAEHEIAASFAARVYELTQFLADVRNVCANPGGFKGRVVYHDACAGLRELGVKQQPRRLLSNIDGLDLIEVDNCESCCGFGGAFCAKFPDISNAIVGDKVETIAAANPDVVLAGDLGCLLHMAAGLKARGSTAPCRHIAEVLSGDLDAPPITSGSSPS